MIVRRVQQRRAAAARRIARSIVTCATAALLGCMGGDPLDPPLPTYSGQYVVASANGQPLPVNVTTSYGSGELRSAGFTISNEPEFRLTLSIVEPAPGGRHEFRFEGIVGRYPDKSMKFVTFNGQVIGSGRMVGTSDIHATIAGLDLDFRWGAPYREAGSRVPEGAGNVVVARHPATP